MQDARRKTSRPTPKRSSALSARGETDVLQVETDAASGLVIYTGDIPEATRSSSVSDYLQRLYGDETR